VNDHSQGESPGRRSRVKTARAVTHDSPPRRSNSRRPAPALKRSDNRRVHREFSAGFILFRHTPAGPVYLLLDYGKHWDYPKGHLEEGETAWQAAVRELREETGIRQVDRVTRFQRDMHYFFVSSRKGRIAKTVTYFLGQTRSEKITISDEHSGYAWLGYDDALERLTYENAREMLRAAHESLLHARSKRR
jgi:8-oxo-dGTP pyrophosphatase MutT (NUDIX family)